jgi:uncharacterized membrane protein
LAGVGFKLRELLNSTDGALRLQGAAASFLITAGPMIFMALGFFFFEQKWLQLDFKSEDSGAFMGMLVYAYMSAWLSVGLFEHAVTRYFSDLVYLHYLNTIPRIVARVAVAGMLLSGLFCFLVVTVLGIDAPYSYYSVMLAAVLGATYSSSLFINATRSYIVIILSYVLAIITAIALKNLFFASGYFGAIPKILAWMIGQAVIFAVQIIAIHSEFGIWNEAPPNMVKYLVARRNYLYLGIVSALAPCVDRLTFWFSPVTSSKTFAGFLNYPPYDLGMFYASVVVLPGLAMFLVKIETAFHLAIRDEFNAAEQDASYSEIGMKARHVSEIAIQSVYEVFFLQVSFAIILFLVTLPGSKQLMTPEVTAVFRWGLLGYSVFLPMVVCNVFMLYFSRVRNVAIALTVFVVVCFLGSLVTSYSSPLTHGAGFFFASLVGFLVSFVQLNWILKHHTVIVFTEYDDAADILPVPFNLENLRRGEF